MLSIPVPVSLISQLFTWSLKSLFSLSILSGLALGLRLFTVLLLGLGSYVGPTALGSLSTLAAGCVGYDAQKEC